MITRVDERLRRETKEFRLRFRCEDCVHFDPPGRACGNGYPTEPHRDVHVEQVEELCFCKDFELA